MKTGITRGCLIIDNWRGWALPPPKISSQKVGFLNRRRRRLSVGRLVGQWSMYVLNPTTYVAQGSGLPSCGRWYLLQPCKSCCGVFLLSQGLKGRFEGFGGGRQIPLQAGRILIIILIEDKVECRVGVWVAPKFEGESRQSGVKHVCSLRGSDCN